LDLDRADSLIIKVSLPKAFQQCAGFLRIRDGAEPLDASAVHHPAKADAPIESPLWVLLIMRVR
jgi:hypothetical protein